MFVETIDRFITWQTRLGLIFIALLADLWEKPLLQMGFIANYAATCFLWSAFKNRQQKKLNDLEWKLYSEDIEIIIEERKRRKKYTIDADLD